MNGIPSKQRQTFQKHGVRFSEALSVFSDEYAVTIPDEDSDANEQRFVTLGMGLKARVLIVVYCYRENDKIRIISARIATPSESVHHEANR